MAGDMSGRGHAWQGGVHERGCAWQGMGGACMAGETATPANSTHPTGTHSCYYFNLNPVPTSFRRHIIITY